MRYSSLTERRKSFSITHFYSTLTISIIAHSPNLSFFQNDNMIIYIILVNTSCSYLSSSSQRFYFSTFTNFSIFYNSFLKLFNNRILINLALIIENPNVSCCKFDIHYIFCYLLNLFSLVVMNSIYIVLVCIYCLCSPNP